MNKTIWIIANWKSNKNIQEALEWVEYVGPKLQGSPSTSSGLKIIVCPSFIDIEEVKKAVLVGNYPMLVGSQDLSPYDVGAFTGEESASILKQFVDLAILGHSERRQNFGETDELVVLKVTQALEHNITPLVCVQDSTTPIPEGCNLVAYEPIFAIGTGNPDTPQNAESVAEKIKQGREYLEVLYGGSVTSENAKAYLQMDNISGLLVGKASLNPEEFVKIVQQGN